MNLCRIYHPLKKIKPRLIQSFKFASGSSNKPPFSIVDLEFPRCKGMITFATSFRFLDVGMILYKNLISFSGQVEIVKICQEYGVRPGGFYQPCNRSGKKQLLGRHMMCFGRNWDPQRKYDGSEVPPIPEKLISLAEDLNVGFQRLVMSREHPAEELPSMSADVCLVNFIEGIVPVPHALHQDCDESSDSLKRGLPVISIFIGDSVEFLYGRASKECRAESILIESGDVLIYGGLSRHIFHRLKKVLDESAPLSFLEETSLKSGCLSLTFKQF